MNKKIFTTIYFYAGGAIVIATVVGFFYNVLFGGLPTLLQWLAAVVLFGIGTTFMAIGDPDTKEGE